MSEHLGIESVELYVQNILDGDDARALESHSAACPQCAELLAREARIQLALEEAASLPTPIHWRRRSAVAIAAGLAAAAVLLISIRPAQAEFPIAGLNEPGTPLAINTPMQPPDEQFGPTDSTEHFQGEFEP